MAFTLKIRLVGLCFLVQDSRRSVLQILMPTGDHPAAGPTAGGSASGHGHAHGPMTHTALVRFQKMYGGPATKGEIDLATLFELDLTGQAIGATGVAAKLPPEIVSASDLAARAKVRRPLLAVETPPSPVDPPDPKLRQWLNARLVLPANTTLSRVFPWLYDVPDLHLLDQPYATAAEISLAMVGTTLVIGAESLTAKNQLIELTVGNLPPGEWSAGGGTFPGRGVRVDHFDAYYALLEGQPRGARIYTGSFTEPEQSSVAPWIVGPNPVTCLLGGGDG